LKPLIRLLGIGESSDDDYSRSRVRQVAIASAIAELEDIANKVRIPVMWAGDSARCGQASERSDAGCFYISQGAHISQEKGK
jgi:hypothetical protein